MWQVFSLVGLVLGLWTVGWVAQWVGAHWHGARPAAVFWVLGWVVAALAGLAVATLLQWWGGLLGDALKQSPAGWLDRLGGFVVGAALGALVSAFVLLAVLLAPWPYGLPSWAAGTRVAPPLMRFGAGACSVSERFVPGSRWLKQRFLFAERLADDSVPI